MRRGSGFKWACLLGLTLFGFVGCARDVVTRGYLTDGYPVSLRFAPPEPEFPAQLPPLPITLDPQPSGAFEIPPVPSMPEDELSAVPAQPGQQFTAPQAADRSQPEMPMEGGVVLPPMFLRFFPDGRPAGVELLAPAAAAPSYFTVPSSSAEYRRIRNK